MSKFLKSQSEDNNALFNWKIHTITKSDRCGRLDNGPESQRSKIFWIRMVSGKIINLNHEKVLKSSFLGGLKSYRISKILDNSWSMLCRGKKCSSRISIAFDTEKIKCKSGKILPETLAVDLDNKMNYRCFHQHSEKMCLGANFNSYGSLRSVAQANDNACKVIAHSQDCPNNTEHEILLKRTKEIPKRLYRT